MGLALSLMLCLGGFLYPQGYASSPSASEGLAYAQPGPWSVGARDLSIEFQAEGVKLPATVWYPMNRTTGTGEVIRYAVDTRGIAPDREGFTAVLTGQAIRDGAAAQGAQPCPLVVFTPGSGTTHLLYSRFLEHLASYGFAVLGLTHMPDAYSRRPKDVMRAIDFALGPGALPVRIDPSRIAVMGHSLGGKTAMNVSGVSFGRSSLDPFDRRIKAMVAWAMGSSTLNMDPVQASAAMLFIHGSLDDVKPVEDLAEVYQAMPMRDKALVILVGAGHGTFTDPALRKDRDHMDWGTLDDARAATLINHFTTAFLLDALAHDATAHQALLPGQGTIPEIQYSTTLK